MSEEREKVATTSSVKKTEDEKPKRQVCNICHGMGVKELLNGDTIDCPVRSCENGYVKIR